MMLTKAEATYEIAKPDGDRCDQCKWYRPERCDLVEGSIDAGGWCKVFHRKARRIPDDVEHNRSYVRRMRASG